MRKKFLPSFILFVGIVFLACSKDTDAPDVNSDPLMGNWKLKVITVNGQSQDVSNAACWKDSYISLDASAGKMYLSYPDQNTGTCAGEQESFQWSNKNGVYYIVQNGQEAPMPAQLLDNNQTLQMSLSEGNQTIIFSFRK